MAKIDKLISKVNSATSAINSLKGIKSKLSGMGYEAFTNVDKLEEERLELRRKLQERRNNLKSNIGADGVGFAIAKGLSAAKQKPSEGEFTLKYPFEEDLYDGIAFNFKKRRQTSDDSRGKNLLNSKDVSIRLYVPSGYENNIAVQYNGQDVGLFTQAMVDVIGAFEGSATGDVGQQFQNLASTGFDTLKNKVTAGANNISKGRAVNPMKEQLLEGVGFRSFSFKFDFMPTSQKEAEIVNDICYLFKIAMLPDTYASVQGDSELSENYFNYPNIVKLEWMGDCKKVLDGFLPAVITQCDVSYNDGSSWVSHYDGHPVKTSMSINVQEVKILTQENYARIAATNTNEQHKLELDGGFTRNQGKDYFGDGLPSRVEGAAETDPHGPDERGGN